jgi:hypothetical protein
VPGDNGTLVRERGGGDETLRQRNSSGSDEDYRWVTGSGGELIRSCSVPFSYVASPVDGCPTCGLSGCLGGLLLLLSMNRYFQS